MMIYIGRLPKCGCVVAATIDADDVGEMARNGYLIETVTAESVQVPGCKCAARAALSTVSGGE